jgi:hypothetical protein
MDKQHEEFIKKQWKLYEEKGLPFFMSSNGICPGCGQDCIAQEIAHGNDGSKSVTGCHVCCKSFCD